jgi:zinc-binding alcohol dehydrogenase family protein
VLRLLVAEGMVCLGVLSLDGTKLAGNAAQKANKTLPHIGKLLAEAAAADAAEDARYGDALGEPAPRALAVRAERRQRLAAARDRLAAEDAARRDAQRAKQQAWDAAAAAGKRRGHRPGDEPPRPNRNNTEPRANITDPDVRVMRNQKGYVAGYNGQLVVTAQQVIVGAMLSQHPVDRTLLGKRVLVTGATGGVGRMAVQLAQLAGAQVTALVRDPAASAGVLRRLGATVVTAELAGDFDVIVEGVGGVTFGLAIEHLAPRGVLVNIATQDDAETVTFRARGFDRAAGARIYTLDLPGELTAHASGSTDLARLCALAAAGRLDAQIELACSWRQPAEAIGALLGRRIGGKAVLHID